MQFVALFSQLGDAGGIVGGSSGAHATVDFGLSDPVAQCLAVDAELVGDPGDPAAAGGGVLARVKGRAGSSRTEFVGIVLLALGIICPCCGSLHQTQGDSYRLRSASQ